jgi:two-component system nitrate/nitrite response regulator NarL
LETKILLIGSGRMVRESVKHQLAVMPHQLVGEFEDWEDLIGAAATLPAPHVIVTLDPPVSMLSRQNFQSLSVQWWPDTKTVALVTRADQQVALMTFLTGFDGCLFADMSPDVLPLAIQLVVLGVSVFPTRIGRNLAVELAAQRRPNLTPREIQILQGLLAGQSNKTIANTIGSTDMTVKAQLRHLLRKLGVTNRTQAALWAQENGFDPTPRR